MLLDRAMLTYTFALEKPWVSNIVIPEKEGFVTRESSDAPVSHQTWGGLLKVPSPGTLDLIPVRMITL